MVYRSPMVYTKSDRKSIRNLFDSSPLKDTSNKILNAPLIKLEDTGKCTCLISINKNIVRFKNRKIIGIYFFLESDTNCLCFDTPKVKTSLNRLRSSSFHEYETSTQKHLLGKGSFGYVIRSRYKGLHYKCNSLKVFYTNLILQI